MRVLMADPNRDILLTYQKLFALRGDTADCVFDGTQTTAYLTRGGYDLFIVNKSLPRLPAEKLVLLARQQSIPSILLIDAHISTPVLLGGPPAAAFLALPFPPEILFGYADAIVQKARGAERFSIGAATVDVSGFCFADSNVFLTSKEIDLLRTLRDGSVLATGRHLTTYINALNNKLAGLRLPCRIEYVLQKGYCMVDNHE